jgi:hypothetical protein
MLPDRIGGDEIFGQNAGAVVKVLFFKDLDSEVLHG